MKRSEIIFGIVRIPVDAALTVLALLCAYWLRSKSIDLIPNVQLLESPSSLPPLEYFVHSFVLPATLAMIAILALMSLYSLKSTLGPWKEIGRVLGSAIIWLCVVIAWFFLVQKQLFYSRILLLQATGLIALFVVIGRTVIVMIQRMFLRRGVGIRTVLSCGGTHLPQVMGDYFEEDVRFRYIGHTLTTADVMSRHSAIPIDLVLHTDPKPESGDTSALIEYCRSHQIGYAFLPPVFADVPHLLSIGYAGLTPMLRFEPTPLDGWGRVWKRASDLVLGVLLLILLSPVLILVAALILLTCGWPIFYISKRTGQYGKQMVPLLKFRTMCRDADLQKPELVHMSHRGDGPLFKIKNDPRITPIGRFLRRWSIDELPQLLNVVAGHLSLVGPRPHLPNEVARYSQSQHRVFTVRPGVTGLAQISGRSDLSFEEEVQLDMRYIEDWSLALDLWIIWRTVAVVLSGKGAD